jgi:hypothetical protein
VTALGRQRQEDWEFQASLGYTARLSQKNSWVAVTHKCWPQEGKNHCN